MKRYRLKFDLPWFGLKAGDVFEPEGFPSKEAIAYYHYCAFMPSE